MANGVIISVKTDGFYLYFQNVFHMMSTRHAETNAQEAYC